MTTTNPATPAQAATPGNTEQIKPTTPAVAPVSNQGQGEPQEGKVTISTKEFAQLQRDSARVRSFEKRKQFTIKQNAYQNQTTGSDDQTNEEIQRLSSEKAAAESRALRAEVRSQVQELVNKEEFKAIPKSTRDLILKNPQMLSNADNVEEALLDIEDFLREQATEAKLSGQGQQSAPAGSPAGHETPPVVNAGAPAPAGSAGLEDISNLHGPSRSRAVLRNKIQQSRGVK